MASALKYKQSLNQTRLDAITTAIGSSGFLDIYDGTQATNPDTAVGAQVKLAHLALSATAFGSASAAHPSVITANAISNDTSADATGTATWFRITTSAGVAIVDGSAGTSGTDLVLDSASFTAGQVVSVSSLTITSAS